MKHGSVLEKLVHNLHMYETLRISGNVYKRIVKKLKKKNMERKMNDICSCIQEEDSHIKSLLTIMANSMREAGNVITNTEMKNTEIFSCDKQLKK